MHRGRNKRTTAKRCDAMRCDSFSFSFSLDPSSTAWPGLSRRKRSVFLPVFHVAAAHPIFFLLLSPRQESASPKPLCAPRFTRTFFLYKGLPSLPVLYSSFNDSPATLVLFFAAIAFHSCPPILPSPLPTPTLPALRSLSSTTFLFPSRLFVL